MKQDLYQAPDYFKMDELLSEEHLLIRDAAREWVKREISPIIENPFDTELDQLTAILKPIAVSETLGMTRNDLFSDMFRDKLGRLLVSAFNAAMYDAGYEKIVSRVEIIDFWSP